MEKLESDKFYHIYNRGNNKQDIFFEKDNYIYFLTLIERHLTPVSKIISYCLLPNHFHLILKFKDALEKPSQPLSNLLNAYTKAINKRFNRTGSLFQKPFKRIEITNENYLRNLILYVHLNPKSHGIHEDYQSYLHSSFSLFNQDRKSFIDKKFVIDLFGDKGNFNFSHSQKKIIIDNDALFLEH